MWIFVLSTRVGVLGADEGIKILSGEGCLHRESFVIFVVMFLVSVYIFRKN